MFDLLSYPSWFLWGAGLTVGFPLLALILGETSHRLEEKNSALTGPLHQLRHIILPSLVFLLLMEKVLGYSGENITVRGIETLFWLVVLSVSLSIFNVIFFQYAKENSWQSKVPKLLLDLSKFFLILIGGAIILSLVWDANLGRLLTALGVGSVVIGLALQDTLGGLFAGVALLSGKQFLVGDWLKVGDVEGQIVEMNWRSVSLLTREKDLQMIPNSVIAKDSFRNFSRPNPLHMERVPFDFSFDDAPHKVKQVLITAALDTPGILHQPKPEVSLITYGEFTVTHEIRFFINEFERIPCIRDAFISRIWYAAKRHHLTFPTRSHEVYYFDGQQNDRQDRATMLTEQLLALNAFGMSRTALHNLSAGAKVLHYGVGEYVLKQGENSRAIRIILEGAAIEKLIDHEGKEKQLQHLNAGDFFGLISLLRKCPSDTTVITEKDMLVAELNQKTIKKVLDNDPNFAHELEQLVEIRNKAIYKLTHKDLDKHQNLTANNLLASKNTR